MRPVQLLPSEIDELSEKIIPHADEGEQQYNDHSGPNERQNQAGGSDSTPAFASTSTSVSASTSAEFTLSLRIPSWCGGRYRIQVNGSVLSVSEGDPGNGYVELKRVWQVGDTVDIAFEMPVLRMKGHPLIRDTIGKTALQHGPFVYCMEEADNGPQLHQVVLARECEFDVRFEPGLLGGLSVITAAAERVGSAEWQADALYANDVSWSGTPVTATFIPYYAWANRGVGEMMVWVRDSL
ncbi:beta-L-arabinofuranosidase domain-containing protein [Paenibacillus sp. OV219]|uniref:beta-L-arabinofuranosidase domain-containing protein n=1 Tax=Paenibacillus sp. OV219 TaxID=1884377 RepID=UPI0008CF439C|nr:beta-L-arabinofuranosidase domain-containing protein [Paenibacillus sp. OV219]SEO38175.1 hypothetical protein SAMN05518847_107248 [Paenibacillus sp. OV219]